MLDFSEDNNVSDTCIYGSVTNQNYLEIKSILGNKILYHKLKKIKCQLKPDTCIVGIQFIYTNIYTGEDKTLIDISSEENNLIEDEFDLNNREVIIDMKVWLNNDVRLIGFQIITNKNRKKKFGYGNEGEMTNISVLKNLDQIVVGFGIYNDDNYGITAIYGEIINRKKYLYNLLNGVFELRYKLKKSDFKEKVEKKLEKLDENKKILYRICQLPDNQFFNVMKYSIDNL